MPTVVSAQGILIIVRTHDHRPPHVHVEGAGWELRVLIGKQALLWDFVGGDPSNREVKRAVALVGEHLEACNKKWKAIHG